MPRVIVKLGQPLSQIMGQRKFILDLAEESTVASLLDALNQQQSQFQAEFRGDNLGRTNPYILFRNGRPLSRQNYATTYLQDGDVIHLVLPVVGGCDV